MKLEKSKPCWQIPQSERFSKVKKVLLKVSGEAFANESGIGVCRESLERFAKQIAAARKIVTHLALVVGGGNFWRARDFQDLGIDRVGRDEIGMLATGLNGAILREFLQCSGIEAATFPAKDFSMARAKQDFANGKVVIFTGGTGNPFFTTDSAAVLRALQLDCDAILKGTKVDGVFDSDPARNPGAKKFAKLTLENALAKDLKVLDRTAFALLLEKRIPLHVFNILENGSLQKVLQGQGVGTMVV